MTPIRHQLDDMPPPYNYTAIDENLNGFFTANDTTTALFFDETSCDKVDGSENSDVRYTYNAGQYTYKLTHNLFPG